MPHGLALWALCLGMSLACAEGQDGAVCSNLLQLDLVSGPALEENAAIAQATAQEVNQTVGSRGATSVITDVDATGAAEVSRGSTVALRLAHNASLGASATRAAAKHAAGRSWQRLFGRHRRRPAEVEEMLQMLLALQSALEDPEFQKIVDEGIVKLQAIISDFSQQSKDLNLNIVQLSNGTEGEDFATLLADYFNKTLAARAAHGAQAENIRDHIAAAMPPNLRASVEPVLGTFFSGNTAVPFDYSAFKATPAEQMCGQVERVMDYMQDYQFNLTKVNGLLNTTAGVLPMLGLAFHGSPKAPEARRTSHGELEAVDQEVTLLMNSLLDIVYRETSAREKLASDLQELVAPAIADKLECSDKGAGDESWALSQRPDLSVAWPASLAVAAAACL